MDPRSKPHSTLAPQRRLLGEEGQIQLAVGVVHNALRTLRAAGSALTPEGTRGKLGEPPSAQPTYRCLITSPTYFGGLAGFPISKLHRKDFCLLAVGER